MVDIALKNGFETFPFLEKDLEPRKCCLISKKRQAVNKILQKYLVKDVVGEIMTYFTEYNYPDLENPTVGCWNQAHLELIRSRFCVIVSYTSKFFRGGDILFGVYSEKMPLLMVMGWKINLLATNVVDGEQKLWMLETPVYLRAIPYSPVEICSSGITKAVYGLRKGPSGSCYDRGDITEKYTYKNLVTGHTCVSKDDSLHVTTDFLLKVNLAQKVVRKWRLL